MQEPAEGQEGQGEKPATAMPRLAAALAAAPPHPIALMLTLPDGLAVLLDKFALLAEDDRQRALARIPAGVFAALIGDERP